MFAQLRDWIAALVQFCLMGTDLRYCEVSNGKGRYYKLMTADAGVSHLSRLTLKNVLVITQLKATAQQETSLDLPLLTSPQLSPSSLKSSERGYFIPIFNCTPF